MNRSKQIGTSAESAVVKLARSSGFPYAERRALAGTDDQGDVKLDSRGRVILEVKAGKAAETASDSQVAAWLVETEREREAAGAWYGFLVLKRAGKGPRNAGQWWAVGRLDDLALLYHWCASKADSNPAESPIVRVTVADLFTLLTYQFGEDA